MENQAVDAVTLAGAVAATDFSLWALFLKADLVVTGNPGCILQFRQGLARAGLDIEVKHPMQIAAAAVEV